MSLVGFMIAKRPFAAPFVGRSIRARNQFVPHAGFSPGSSLFLPGWANVDRSLRSRCSHDSSDSIRYRDLDKNGSFEPHKVPEMALSTGSQLPSLFSRVENADSPLFQP